MRNRKIGIITFHAAENFGSALQAFALQNVLKKYGCESEIIDFLLESDMCQYKIFRTDIYKNRPKAFLGDLLYYKRNKRRKNSFEKFRKEFLEISSNKYYSEKSDLTGLNECYDIFICGSDQIWNLNCTGRMVPEFFLSFADDSKKKIAYAPSMPKEVSEEYFEDIRRYIKRLDFVSVREEQTIGYLKNKVKVEADIIHAVDPTLLLDAGEYITRFKLKRSNEKHIFIYILDATHFNSELIEKAQEIVAVKKLKIKYMCMRRVKKLKNAEYCMGMGPIEFLESIYNASYVITDSFHATVFSIHFHIPFCVLPRKGSESRMVELLNILGLDDNLYSPNNKEWINSNAGNNTDAKLKSMAKNSLDFLLRSLE